MSAHRIVLAPAAERDIAHGFLWYRERNERAANAFRAEVYDAIEAIANAPLTSPVDAGGIRRRLLRRFPYSIFFELQAGTVTVLAVAHQRRSPNYWRPPPR